MTVPAIIAFKNPARAKHRLAPVLNDKGRASLACSMLSHVLCTLKESREIGRISVVAEDAEAEAICVAHAVNYLREPANRGYNEAVSFALQALRDDTAAGVVLLASDLPLVSAYEIDAFARPAAPGTVRIATSRDGAGSNGLFLNPPGIIGPSFGVNSAQRHRHLAAVAGVDAEMVHLRGLAFDIDTPSDLRDFIATQACTTAQTLLAQNYYNLEQQDSLQVMR